MCVLCWRLQVKIDATHQMRAAFRLCKTLPTVTGLRGVVSGR